MFFIITSLIVVGFAAWNQWDFIGIARLWPDEAYYAWLAKRILSDPSLILSKEIISFHPPLFAVILALGTFASSTILACRKVLFAIYLLGIGAAWGIGRRWKGIYAASLCAVLLACHPFYFEFTNVITMDTLLMVAGFLLMGALWRAKGATGWREDFIVGVLAVVMIGLKWSGALVIPYIVLYYLWGLAEVDWTQRVKRMRLPLGMALVTVGGLCWNNWVQIGTIFPTGTSLGFGLNGQKLLAAGHGLVDVIGVPLIPLFVYGLVKVAKGEQSTKVILLGWLAVFAAGVIFNQEFNNRFILLLLPATLLITVAGIESGMEVLSRGNTHQELVRHLVFILLVFIGFLSLPHTIRKVEDLSLNSAGYGDVSGVISKSLSPDMVIYATSPRQIRYFSGVNFKEFGGQIEWLNYHHTKEAFERMVSTGPKHILLEIDVWDQHRPLWSVYKDNLEFGALVDYLSGLGFRLIHVVEHKRGETVTPAVLLFKRSYGKK